MCGDNGVPAELVATVASAVQQLHTQVGLLTQQAVAIAGMCRWVISRRRRVL